MSTRQQNERKFPHWIDLPNGGRRYWLDVAGRHGWWARYVKEVDVQEWKSITNFRKTPGIER